MYVARMRAMKIVYFLYPR